MSLHNTQEFDDHLGRGADQNLPLATPLGVDDVVLSQNRSLAIAGMPKPEGDEQDNHSA